MALGTPYNVGSKAQAAGVTTTVVNVGTDANGDATTVPAAGESVFVLIGAGFGSAAITSVTDAKANTYVLSQKVTPANNESVWIYECLNPGTHLAAADAVTVTWTASTSGTTNVRVIGCAGVASSSADDTSGTTSGSSTAPSAATGSGLAQASELVISVIQSGNATGGVKTWGNSFTQMGHNLRSGSGSYLGVAVFSTTTTAAVTSSATLTTTGGWGQIVATYKASTGGAGALSIVQTSPLPAGQVGVAYTDQLTATGGITPYTWAITAGALPAGLTLASGTGGNQGTGDITYAGLNAGPGGAPTIAQLNAVNAAFGPVGCTKFFFSSGGSGIYTGLLGGDANGGGSSGWSASGGSAGYTCATITAAIPGIFIQVNWGAMMSATAINNFVSSIPRTVAEVGFCFQSEPEHAYAASAGAQFVSDYTDQANKIRAAQALTTVKLTLMTAHYYNPYQVGGSANAAILNGSFIPRADVVDVPGLDFYDRKVYWNGPDFSTSTGFVNWVNLVKGQGKPLCFPEYGISGAASAAEQNSRLQADWAYIQGAFGAGGTLSPYPLYMWNYWNVGGTGFSTAPPSTINQMLSAAVNSTWAAIEASAGGQNSGTPTGTGGAISGTPTAVVTNQAVTIRVTDAASVTASTAFTMTTTAAGALAITNTSPLPGGTTGVAYTTILTAVGGTAPYTWSLLSGTLPTGLAISGQTITGTPTVPGTSAFTLKVTDNVAATATLAASVTISSALSITTSSPLPGAAVGVSYTTTLAAVNGTTPYTWQVTAGVLPDGLILDTAAGVISGTPTTAGVGTFTVTVTDSAAAASATAAVVFTLPVASTGVLATPGRRKFGGGDADFAISASGTSITLVPNAVVTFWTALSGGSQYTDLQNTGGGAITSVTADANGQIPEFFGPAGIWKMAADAGGGTRRWVTASDIGDFLNAVYTSVHALGG